MVDHGGKPSDPMSRLLVFDRISLLVQLGSFEYSVGLLQPLVVWLEIAPPSFVVTFVRCVSNTPWELVMRTA